MDALTVRPDENVPPANEIEEPVILAAPPLSEIEALAMIIGAANERVPPDTDNGDVTEIADPLITSKLPVRETDPPNETVPTPDPPTVNEDRPLPTLRSAR